MSTAIPHYISRTGIITAKVFLLHAAVYDSLGYTTMTKCSCLLYLTSYLHWNKLKSSGIIKNIDIITVFSCIAYMRLHIRQHFLPKYQYLWDTVTCICGLTYATNTYIYYNQVIDSSIKRMTEKYKYFLLEYTHPNTIQRLNAYYYNTYTHLGVMHILSSVTSIVCIYFSSLHK